MIRMRVGGLYMTKNGSFIRCHSKVGWQYGCISLGFFGRQEEDNEGYPLSQFNAKKYMWSYGADGNFLRPNPQRPCCYDVLREVIP